jgi:outer membrane protein TolC
MLKLQYIFILFTISLNGLLYSQKKLSFEEFKGRLMEHHPVIKQAKNMVLSGEFEVMKAKGQLDPAFFSELSSKQFEGKEYYNLSNTGLKIPTYLGIDLKTGYEINKGYYINDESQTPGSGLWYAGIEIPLGEGLFFDERREMIQKAKVFQQMNENEQRLLVNDLILDAFASYNLWIENFQKLKIAEEGLNFAKIRFVGVKESAIQGDIPIIDTVEAKIQLKIRESELLQRQNDYKNTQQTLNLYLWTENMIPLELENETIPANDFQLNFQSNKYTLQALEETITSNPYILNYMYKLEQLNIEERWKKEQLKPDINLSYNPLSRPVGNNPLAEYSMNNYKFGFQVYVPLFMRKERGSYRQIKLKVENASLDLSYKTAELKQKITILRNDIFTLNEQLIIQKLQVEQAKQLRDSEQTRFDIGESSLFMINTREQNYLNMKIKLTEMEAKMKILEYKWLWIFNEIAK